MNDFHNSRKPNCSGCIVFFNRSSCRLQRALTEETCTFA